MPEALQVKSATLTHPGQRPNNEDFIAFFEPEDLERRQASGCIYVVADGVGGAYAGERASRHAAERLTHDHYEHPDLEPGARLRMAIRLASQEIFDFSESMHRRMATTVVAAVILDGRLTIASVGDSRAYLIRGGRSVQLTRDHNVVGELLENGLLTEEEAFQSKAKNRLTRSVGTDPEPVIDVFDPIPLQVGDRILLCSDGLTRYALTRDIDELAAQGSLEAAAKRLVDFALKSGGADNVSVILVEILPPAAGGAAGLASAGRLPAQVEPLDMDESPTVVPKRFKAAAAQGERWKYGLSATLLTVATLVLILAIAMIRSSLSGQAEVAAATVTSSAVTQPASMLDTLAAATASVPATTPATVLSAAATLTASPPTVSSPSPTFVTEIPPEGPSATPSPTPTLTPTHTETPTATVSPTPAATTAVPGAPAAITCVVQVKPGDNLSTLLWDGFKINYEKVSTHHYYLPGQCRPVDGQTHCEQVQNLNAPYIVQEGWWIVVPGVSIEDVCTREGGTVARP